MKSKYLDNFRHQIVLIPPVLGKKTKQQAKPIVLAVVGSKGEAIRYQADAVARFAKRPGRIVVIPASEQPTVGYRGRRMQTEAA